MLARLISLSPPLFLLCLVIPLDFVNRGEEKKERKKDGARDIFTDSRGSLERLARERVSQSFRQTYLLFHLYEPTIRLPIYAPSFPSLFTREEDNTQRTLDSLYEFEESYVLQITGDRRIFFFFFLHANFRKENLSRDACSRIVNRNIDNYGYNVSRIVN